MTVRILRGILIAVAVSVAAYWRWIRPGKRNWGASVAEVRRPLPGDALLPAPQLEATRAITIHAPPSRVWPWLLQIGQGRGGFYSYDWLENLAGCGVRSATRIHPEWQKLDVGDVVRAHATLPIGWLVRAIEDQRALVLQAANTNARKITTRTVPPFYEFVWSFVLEAAEPGNTRLIIRERYAYDRRAQLTTTIRVISFVSFLMTRKMMLGLKSRSERT